MTRGRSQRHSKINYIHIYIYIYIYIHAHNSINCEILRSQFRIKNIYIYIYIYIAQPDDGLLGRNM